MANKNTAKTEKVIDAAGQKLGRVATVAAMHLMGKDSPSFKRNVFSGAPVKIVNASKLSFTKKKLDTIYHTRYSGIPGGLTIEKGWQTAKKKGMGELVRLATYQMLPDNKLRREMMKNLKIEE